MTVPAQSEPEGHGLPVDTYRDAAPFLRRPFTPAAVKFKVQTTWQSGALIVAYIDARLAVERLNLVCPHLWRDEYRPQGGGLMWCDLTVDGITRSDVGEGKGKGLVSDALKRAAVRFGVGVSLYAIPKMILNNEYLKRKTKGDREEVTLTDAGDQRVRKLYADWLDAHGKRAFGEPLDHGDVEGAQGDAEVDPVASEVPAGVDPTTGEIKEPERPSDVPAPDIWVEEMGGLIAQLKMKGPEIRHGLESIGVEVPVHISAWGRVLGGLAPQQRNMFRSWLLEQASDGTPIA